MIIRPSGTEPKLKVYLDSLGADQGAAEAVLQSLKATLNTLINSFLAGSKDSQ